MAITNLMQDIVLSTVEEVLRNENATDLSLTDRDDIAAYALNRLNPKYVTSEKGLLYGVLEARYQVQQRVDILFLIYEALFRIRKHRGGLAGRHETPHPEGDVMLPHLVGQVLDASSLSTVPGVEVLLVQGDAPAAMIEPGWENPYRTHESTNGHYHFWPKHTGDASHAVSFTLVFTHPDFKEASLSFELAPIGRNEPGKTAFLQAVLLERK